MPQLWSSFASRSSDSRQKSLIYNSTLCHLCQKLVQFPFWGTTLRTWSEILTPWSSRSLVYSAWMGPDRLWYLPSCSRWVESVNHNVFELLCKVGIKSDWTIELCKGVLPGQPDIHKIRHQGLHGRKVKSVLKQTKLMPRLLQLTKNVQVWDSNDAKTILIACVQG